VLVEDLGGCSPAERLARAGVQRGGDRGEILRLADPQSLRGLVARHPRHRGIVKLRNPGPSLTRSELEARFIAFLDHADLARPSVNARVESFEVDFVWHEQRLIAELDGYAFHSTRVAFERDRARDRRLQARGWRVVRITWRQLRDHPASLAAELAALLSRRRT
jgi:very-short-patch-repair endonuclease